MYSFFVGTHAAVRTYICIRVFASSTASDPYFSSYPGTVQGREQVPGTWGYSCSRVPVPGYPGYLATLAEHPVGGLVGIPRN
eukprot:3860882-Rhodomonas_salina.1